MTTNALITHPIVFSAASYVLRVTVDGNTQDLTFSVTAERFYWMGRDGQADAATLGGQGDLLAVLKACLETHPSVWVVNVSQNAGGQVTVAIASGASSFSILWTHANTTLDRTIFGFTADTTSGTTATGANQTKGYWRALRPINEDGRDQVPVIGGLAMTMLGEVAVSEFGQGAKTRELFWDRLNQTQVLTEYAPATAPFGAFEYAWLNAIVRGWPFRLYPDETTVATSSSYTLRKVTSLARPWARAGSYRVRWSLALPTVLVS